MTTDRAVLLRAAAALAQTWGNAAGDPSASLVEVMDEAADELDRLRAENERLREALRDAVWLARLARGSSWPGEMAQRVEDAAGRVSAAWASLSEAGGEQ